MNDLQQIEYAAQLASTGQVLPLEHSNTALEIVYCLFSVENRVSPTSLPILKKLAHHQCFPKSTNSQLNLFIHTKYADLLQDHTYLPTNEIIELASRKLTLIPKDATHDPVAQLLLRELALKVAILLVIAGGDYRRSGLIRMIRKWRDVLLLQWEVILTDDYIHHMVSLIIDDSDEILRIDTIDEQKLPSWSRLIPEGGISENFQQVKILVLPRYYQSIYFSRLQRLVGGESVEQLEQLTMDMIIRNSLPIGSKIDQTKGVLIFGAESESNSRTQMNNHIRQILKVLGEAVSLIP